MHANKQLNALMSTTAGVFLIKVCYSFCLEIPAQECSLFGHVWMQINEPAARLLREPDL